MALFKHSYSGLITGGLGMPACCGLITMGFSVFKCRIEVVEPPRPPNIGGGGGGTIAVRPGFYIPMTKQLTNTTKLVLVSVKIKDKEWKKSYVVDRYKAKIVVKVVDLINAFSRRVTVSIDSFKRAQRKVVAMFNKTTK